MPRIRTIKPEFPQSQSIGRVSREARLCFILLWTLADDSGRLRGHSRMLASLLYPYDDDAPARIPLWLDELEREGCIQRYEVNSDSYVSICNWLIHQKIDKPTKSKLPTPQESSRGLANPRERSSEDQGSRIKEGIKDQGVYLEARELSDSEHMDAMAAIHIAYPKFSGDQDWMTAEHYIRAQVDQGDAYEDILKGVARYAHYAGNGGVSGPAFVMGPAKFFKDRKWRQPWDLPPNKAEVRLDANISVLNDFVNGGGNASK